MVATLYCLLNIPREVMDDDNDSHGLHVYQSQNKGALLTHVMSYEQLQSVCALHNHPCPPWNYAGTFELPFSPSPTCIESLVRRMERVSCNK